MLVSLAIANQHRQVQAQIRNMREWAPWIEGQRSQHRKDGFGEVFARTPLLAGVQFLIGMDENAVVVESRGYRIETLVRLVQQFLDLAAYGNELGPRSHAVRPHVHRAGVQLCGQAGHAHHEELIQVGTQNRQEFHALGTGRDNFVLIFVGHRHE